MSDKTQSMLVTKNPELFPFTDFALDAKMRFDDNAEFRQKDLFSRRDFSQEDPKEVAAAEFDLNYIALDGSIGCMVNGAGMQNILMRAFEMSTVSHP